MSIYKISYNDKKNKLKTRILFDNVEEYKIKFFSGDSKNKLVIVQSI